MKAKKALKRLTKIKELIANLTERYSARVPRRRQTCLKKRKRLCRPGERGDTSLIWGSAKATGESGTQYR